MFTVSSDRLFHKCDLSLPPLKDNLHFALQVGASSFGVHDANLKLLKPPLLIQSNRELFSYLERLNFTL